MTARRIAIIAGEHSGDLLAGPVMGVLNDRLADVGVSYQGVGGVQMRGRGLDSLFPLSDIAVMGPVEIAKRLPLLINRVTWAARETIAFDPELLLIVDSPEFTHPIAKRVRRALPQVPIINYVSPSVWAWRPGRAKRMTAYVDHILALLPFEPDVHRRLGGPACSYVGHPMIERIDEIRGDPAPLLERHGLKRDAKTLVVLPGSRSNEVRLLMEPFGVAVDAIHRRHPDLQVIIPAVASMFDRIAAAANAWSVAPVIVQSDVDKFAAFAAADAALAASGTVTLELALAGLPAVVAYRVDGVAKLLRPLVKVPSIVLPNLVLGENMYPERIQEACTGDELARDVLEILDEGPARARQRHLLDAVERKMLLEGDEPYPSHRAARIILEHLRC